MTKTKLAIILDNFFITITLFVVLFLWINKYLKNAVLTFIICILLSFFIYFALFKHSLKKFNILFLKNKELKFAEKCFNSLLFSDSKSTIDYFEKLLNAKCIEKNIYKNDYSFFYVNVKSTLSSFDFIKANEFYLESKSDLPLCFLCQNHDTAFSELIAGSAVHYDVYPSNEVYLLMKSQNYYPVLKEEKPNKFAKLKLAKNKALGSLSRKHFKSFFLSGQSLILISIFFPFSSHYLFFGTLLLIFSIVCLFRKTSPDKNFKAELSSYVNLNNSSAENAKK